MIHNEIVYLDGTNHVFIEVLDGRIVKLSFEAHPLDVLYEKRKVVGIHVSSIPYLTLKEFNKVYIEINNRLHVYQISDIDQLTNTCFITHTMKRTKASFFVTPVLGENREFFRWNQYFVNTFLSEDHNRLILLYRFFNTDNYKEFEFSLTKNPLFCRLIEYDHQHTAVEFMIPDEQKDDIQKFIEGSYSQMSSSYKASILSFHGLKNDALIGKVLFKSDDRRKQLEFDLGTVIPSDVELYDKPDHTEIYQDKNKLILAL